MDNDLASAKPIRKTAAQAATWLLTALLLYLLHLMVRPFWVPLAWAVIIAVFFAEVHRWIRARIGSAQTAALVTTTLVTLSLILPLIWVLKIMASQVVELFSHADELWPQLLAALHKLELQAKEWLPARFVPDSPEQPLIPSEQLHQGLQEVSLWIRNNLAGVSTSLASNVAGFAFDVSLAVFALYYCFLSGHGFAARIVGLTSVSNKLRDLIFQEVIETVRLTITSLLLVGALQTVLGAAIFWLLGIASPVLWGAMMGICSIVPIVGTAMIWVPQAIWLMLNGSTFKGLVLLGLGIGVISSADNVLRSLFITVRSKLNPLFVFLGVVGGIAIFGMVGLVLGPVLFGVGQVVLEHWDPQSTDSSDADDSEATPPNDSDAVPESDETLHPNN